MSTTSVNTAHATPRNRSFIAKSSFARSIKSELLKLTHRSYIITALIGIVLYVGLVSLIAPMSDESYNADFVTSGWPFIILFFIIIGARIVTDEYNHNTMRTTSLADPHRMRAAVAKASALALFASVLAIVLVALCLLVVYLASGDKLDITGEGYWILGKFIIALVLCSLLAMGLGYIFRSTAATIGISVVIFYILDLISLIPMDFFRITLPKFLPSSLLNNSFTFTDFVSADHMMINPNLALGILAIYVIVIVALGFISYRKRDI